MFVVLQVSLVESTVLGRYLFSDIAFILACFVAIIMEKTQRMCRMEKQEISQVIQLVGGLITSQLNRLFRLLH